MDSKIFFPKNAGSTKQEVIDRIEEQIENNSPTCYGMLGKVNPELLTDALMQEYVDNDYDTMFHMIEFGDDAVGRETEKVLFELAKKLTNSPDVEFNQNYGGEEEEDEEDEE